MVRRGLWIVVGLAGWMPGGTASAGEPPVAPTVHRAERLAEAIDAPAFVAAREARIPGHAWVMGLVVDGEARAYSLDLLNRHEVVNDRSRYLDFAVVWAPMANTAAVFDRHYGNDTLTFSPAPGTVRGTPGLRDDKTKSRWCVLSGEAVDGKLKGTKLRQLMLGRRVLWRDWVAAHPKTRVLAVKGVTHWNSGAYANYFASADGYGGVSADDRRLATKASVFAFRMHALPWAVVHGTIEGGHVFDVDGSTVFIYRQEKSPPFESTAAFLGDTFTKEGDVWIETKTGCRFDRKTERFEGARICPRPIAGFDTFWYAWSLTNPKTKLLW